MDATYHVKAREIGRDFIETLESTYHDQELVILTQDDYAELEKARRNAEYLTRIDQAIQDIAEGKGITVTMKQMEAMEHE
jgi:antitoxin YefM